VYKINFADIFLIGNPKSAIGNKKGGLL